jgi:arsenate reductase (glutaredoxin)
MKKVYYLSTCSTSKRIIKELNLEKYNYVFQDIKFDAITEEQLEVMHKMSGSYESLFSKIARKYKELGLKQKSLTENDFKSYILNEYTFLKRPVIIINNSIFIGSSKKNIEAASKKFQLG